MMEKKNNELKLFLVGMAMILLYYVPAMIMGENTFVCIHDFLDSTMSHVKSMKDSGTFFDYDATMPILCGLPRFIYEPAMSVKVWLYALLSPFWGVLVNSLLVRFTAFAGMFLLLSAHVIPDGKYKSQTVFLSSILFASLAFYLDYGVSSAGIPLIAWAFINLYKKDSLVASFAALLYYAVNNNIMLGGFFACGAMCIYLLIDVLKNKRFPLLPFVGMCFLAVTCILPYWNMIVGFYGCDEPFTRSEYVEPFNFLDLLGGLSVLFVGQYHASCFLAVVIVAVFILIWKKYRTEDRFLDYVFQAFVVMAAVIVLTAVLKRALNCITFIREFQIDRFFFLYPAFCFAMVGCIIYEMYRHGKTKALGWFVGVLLVSNLAFDINFRENIIVRTGLAKDSPTFKEFYDVKLMDEIKQKLSIRDFQDKVACLGFPQAVAEYNDIYTVDGYIQMYPLSYKEKFQKVIQGELDKSEELTDYFCNWGSRCYIFSAELGTYYLSGKNCGKTIKQLDIDTAALADLGCKYLFSSVPVDNYAELGLEPAGTFSNDDSYWSITVYKVPQSNF